MDQWSVTASARFARTVDLPGRGRTVVWDHPGPRRAATLVLLHGVTLTAELNWFGVVATLRRRYRVVTLDLPGHGDGLPCRRPFTLEDCADDIAATAGALGIDRFIPVGYSMGGFVAQLLWRRHPHRVAGLVLCATARTVWDSPLEQGLSLVLPSVAHAIRWLPGADRLGADVLGSSLLDRDSDRVAREWALAQMRRTSLYTALAAMQASCGFASHRWIGLVDVPNAVVVTGDDRIVPARRQRDLARAMPGCAVHEIAGGHGVFLGSPGVLAGALLRACDSVAGSVAGAVVRGSGRVADGSTQIDAAPGLSAS